MSVKPGYEITGLGEIPDGWKVVDILTLLREKPRNGIYKPKGSRASESAFFIQLSDLYESGRILNLDALKKELQQEEIDRYSVVNNDCIVNRVSKRKEGIGKVTVVKVFDNVRRIVFESNMFRLRLDQNKIDVDYFTYFSQDSIYIRQVQRKAKTGNQTSIDQNVLKSINIPLPPLYEQREIASILSTADESIRKSDRIIAKTKELKKGLMQQLFTRGIGHTRFTQTEIGLVPEDWSIKTLLSAVGNSKSLIVGGPFGSNLMVKDYRESGIPIIRLQNIDFGSFIEKDIKFISSEKAEELRYHSFKKGDIVLAKLGDPLGMTCIVPNHFEKGIVVADVVRIRNQNPELDEKYLMFALNSYNVFQQLRREVIGSTRPRVNVTQVRDLLIPVPPLEEQQKIRSILLTLDEKEKKEIQRKEKLEHLKKGLMKDLLTGKVRVKVT
jgi:type I restriction enzyme S subunit